MACGKANDARERSCTSCTGGKRQRIWALYGVGEVLTTWMRLLYPAEAAHPNPSILLSTPDLLSLSLSPHNQLFQGLLNGSYAQERATESCGCLWGAATTNTNCDNISDILAAPIPEDSPGIEHLLDASSREGSVALELASLSVSPISAVRPVREIEHSSSLLLCKDNHSPPVQRMLPHCPGSERPTGVVHPTIHDLSDDSSESDVGIQDPPESADNDILLLEASQELFEATHTEPLVVTLGDDEELSRVVDLSDDDVEERVGGH